MTQNSSIQTVPVVESDKRMPFSFEVNGVPYIAVPSGFSLHKEDTLLKRPLSDNRSVSLADSASFVDYLLRHGLPDTAVYIKSEWACCQGEVFARGIIDDAHAGTTSWRSHVVNLAPCVTKEFSDWRSVDGEDLSQTQLCLFLDKHLSQIVRPSEDPSAPSAAEVMSFASNLSDVKKVEFKKSVRLDNGRVQLQYNEEDGAGAVTIPREFFIHVKPLVGQASMYLLKVSLRYRIVDTTRLIFTLDIRDLDGLIEAIRKDISNDIRQSLAAAGKKDWPIYIS